MIAAMMAMRKAHAGTHASYVIKTRALLRDINELIWCLLYSPLVRLGPCPKLCSPPANNRDAITLAGTFSRFDLIRTFDD